MRNIFMLALVIMTGLAVAGSITETRTGLGSVQKITLTWRTTTNEESAAVGTTDTVNGTLDRVVIPASTSTTGEYYSVTLTDENGIEILMNLADLTPTGSVTHIVPGMPIVNDTGATSTVPWKLCDALNVVVTNCGSNAIGSLILYVSP